MQTLDTKDKYSSCESSSTPPSAMSTSSCFVQRSQKPADILDWGNFHFRLLRQYVKGCQLCPGCAPSRRKMAMKLLKTDVHMWGVYCEISICQLGFGFWQQNVKICILLKVIHQIKNISEDSYASLTQSKIDIFLIFAPPCPCFMNCIWLV